MKKFTFTKKHTGYLIFALAISLICWDLATSSNNMTEVGTYQLESDFDAITAPTTEVKVAVVPSDYTGLTSPTSRSNELTYEQVEDMVRKAIELQGGLDDIVKDKNGDKKIQVMIKPNIVEKNTPSGNGTNTDVRVVKALIKIIYEHTNTAEIIVAEGSPRSGYDDPTSSTSCWESTGYRALLSDSYLNGINFSLLNLNQERNDLEEFDITGLGTAAPHNYKYFVHKTEAGVDAYITVPVLKIHNTGITCALKNQIGTAPGAYYGYNKCGGTAEYPTGLVHDVGHRRWTTEEIVDLSLIAGIDYVVVDAIHILESYKTYNGSNLITFNTIIAGWDPVAVDNVCTRLLYQNPDDIAHITLAEKVGMGTNDPSWIAVVGSSIATVRKKVKRNMEEEGIWGQSNRTWILSKTYTASSVTASAIANEATYIPEAGKDGWSQPVYFFDDRIDLLSYYSGSSGVVSYAFTYFNSPSEITAELWLGYDEGIIVYLNGEEVYKFTSSTIYSDGLLGSERTDINLKKGENTLLVKTYHKNNDYSFALNICEKTSDSDLNGNRVDRLKFFEKTSTSVNKVENISNYELTLYPNPCSSDLTISFNLQKSLMATVDLYDINGRYIANIKKGVFRQGKNDIQCNIADISGQSLKQGMYICVLNAGNYQKSQRLIIK